MSAISIVRRRRSTAGRRSSVGGASLVEVLVSVLVLSIGLLGTAAMQATALRNSQSSLERSQGVIHAYTIFDAMRANPVAARGGGYNNAMCAVPAGGTLAGNDVIAWVAVMRQNLGATACGQINCVGAMCTVTVRWDDSRGTAGAVNQIFSATTRI
ncbi:MAG: type IV pilus modification protein PilV [Lysobacter sp.]|nr:type IV pilus modification protein PilV [Lysobacter sp.]